MNINNLKQIHNVNTVTPDLKYSETTEKWTVSDSVHENLNLGDIEMNLHIAETDNGEVPIIELSENGTFYHGSGTIFTARLMWDLVQEHVGVDDGNIHNYRLSPVDNMDNMYIIELWNNNESEENSEQHLGEVIEEPEQEEEANFNISL